jgi:hypothetical protein
MLVTAAGTKQGAIHIRDLNVDKENDSVIVLEKTYWKLNSKLLDIQVMLINMSVISFMDYLGNVICIYLVVVMPGSSNLKTNSHQPST